MAGGGKILAPFRRCSQASVIGSNSVKGELKPILNERKIAAEFLPPKRHLFDERLIRIFQRLLKRHLNIN
jgi:hypothetical protein